MVLSCQSAVLSQLQTYADSNVHSILICSPYSCGKTYMAKQYSNMIHTDDFKVVQPKMSEVKETVDYCRQLATSITICFENIDAGVIGVSNAVLKLLEEPPKNVYIIVTCKNASNVLPTIISRCMVTECTAPTTNDVKLYADSINFDIHSCSSIRGCLHDFRDVDIASKFTQVQLDHFSDIMNCMYSSDSVSNKMWKMQKFPDGTQIPIDFLLNYIVTTVSNPTIKRIGYNCIRDLASGKIPSHVVLAKFLFDISMI